MAKSSNKEVNRLIKIATQQGWRVEIGGSGHVKFFPPDGEIVVISKTPSSPNSNRNKWMLKKAGLKI